MYPKISTLILVVATFGLSSLAQAGFKPIPWHNCLTREVWSAEKQAWCDRLQILKNSQYNLPEMGTFRLTNGKYDNPQARKNATFVDLPGTIVTGQVGSYPAEMTTSILSTNTGGSGIFQHLVLNRVQPPGNTVVATVNLGDRVQVRKVSLEQGEIQVRLIDQKPDEPLCCPTQDSLRTYRLENNQLKLIKSEVISEVPLDLGPSGFEELPLPTDKNLTGNDPISIAKNIFGIPVTEIEGNLVQQAILIDRVPNRPVVLLSQTGLLDDSVEGKLYRFVFAPAGEEWRLISIGRQVRCRQGRGSQDWGNQSCS